MKWTVEEIAEGEAQFIRDSNIIKDGSPEMDVESESFIKYAELYKLARIGLEMLELAERYS